MNIQPSEVPTTKSEIQVVRVVRTTYTMDLFRSNRFDLISRAGLGSYSNTEVKQQSENNVRRMEGTE